MPWTTPETFTAGQTLTAASMNKITGNDVMLGANPLYRIGTQTRTTNYTIDQTALASATNIFSTSISFTADGSSTYIVEFHAAAVDSAAAGRQMIFIITDSSGNALSGYVASVFSAAGQCRAPVFVRWPYTPAAGSRTVNVRGIQTGGAGQAFMDTVWEPGRLTLWGPQA